MAQDSPADPGQEGGVKAFAQAVKGGQLGAVWLRSRRGKGRTGAAPTPGAAFPGGVLGSQSQMQKRAWGPTVSWRYCLLPLGSGCAPQENA